MKSQTSVSGINVPFMTMVVHIRGKNTRGRRVNLPWKGPKEPRKMAENTYSRATQDLKTAPVNKLHLCSLYTKFLPYYAQTCTSM